LHGDKIRFKYGAPAGHAPQGEMSAHVLLMMRMEMVKWLKWVKWAVVLSMR